MTSSEEIPNSPAMSCTRSLLNHPSYESSTKLAVNELANAAGELWIYHPHSRRLLTPNGCPKFRGRWTLNELNTPCPEQRHDLLQTIRRRVGRDDGEFETALSRGGAHLLDANDDVPRADAKSDQTKEPFSDAALHECQRAQAVDPNSPASDERSPAAAPSSDVSSVVNSSMIAMIRSASAGAMPGSFSKSSRSRSMMSFSVR